MDVEGITREIIVLQKVLDAALADVAKASQGRLLVSCSHGCVQYYERKEDGSRRYVPKGEMDAVRRLAQGDYSRKVARVASAQIKHLTAVAQGYHGGDNRFGMGHAAREGENASRKKPFVLLSDGVRPLLIETTGLLPVRRVYDQLSAEKKCLVSPYVSPDDVFLEAWQSEVPVENALPLDNLLYETKLGHKVRSKSEVIIADRLANAGIPYRYEQAVRLGKEGIVIHPDYLVLNRRLRKECLWEHFGMMDDPSYANHALKKLARYAASGILPGEGLICTFESSGSPLDGKAIDAAIEHYLL